MATRFAIRRDPAYRPLLALFGGTRDRAYVEVDETGIVARFGWYRIAVSRAEIANVSPARWPWWWGIGWRTDFRRMLGLIGSVAGVVRIELQQPRRTRTTLLRIPLKLQSLYVSLEDPDGFIQTVSQQPSRPGFRVSHSAADTGNLRTG